MSGPLVRSFQTAGQDDSNSGMISKPRRRPWTAGVILSSNANLLSFPNLRTPPTPYSTMIQKDFLQQQTEETE